MENINKIETELATKLEGLGFYVKHADGWISYVHKETCLDGGIIILDNEIRCSLKFRVVGDYLTLLDHKQFSCSKIEELVFLHSAIVEYLTELEKSSMNFYSTMQSTGMIVANQSVVNNYLDHFKDSYYDTCANNTFLYYGVSYNLSVQLTDTLELVVTLYNEDSRNVIYNSQLVVGTCEEAFDTVDGLIEDFRVSCGSYRGLIKIVQNNTL